MVDYFLDRCPDENEQLISVGEQDGYEHHKVVISGSRLVGFLDEPEDLAVFKDNDGQAPKRVIVVAPEDDNGFRLNQAICVAEFGTHGGASGKRATVSHYHLFYAENTPRDTRFQMFGKAALVVAGQVVPGKTEDRSYFASSIVKPSAKHTSGDEQLYSGCTRMTPEMMGLAKKAKSERGTGKHCCVRPEAWSVASYTPLRFSIRESSDCC